MKHLAFWAVAVLAFTLFPDELDTGGLVTDIVILLAVVAVATPVLVYFAVAQSLPENVEVTAASPMDVTPELQGLVRGYEALGFERAGEPVRFHLNNEAVLIPLVNVAEQMCATVYRLEAKQAKVSHDVVSCLDSPNCTLTTGQDAGAGVLPAEAITLRQIFQDGAPAELVRHHQQALRFLGGHGLPPLDIAPSAILELIKLSFRNNRKCFMKARAGNTFLALWRTISKRNPYMKPLPRQSGIDDQLRKIPRRRQPKRAPRATVQV